jgi:hypothetical protein
MTAVAPSKVRATIDHLRTLQAARAAGLSVSFTTDPAWLVDQAINRRAGWVEDPHYRGSSMPIPCGHGSTRRTPLYRKATGQFQRHLPRLAREVNTPRLRITVQSLGEHRWLADRLPHRFSTGEDA